MKTEGDCTVIDNRGGHELPLRVGLLYVVYDSNPRVPSFRNSDATLRAAFVEESFRPNNRYPVYVQGHDNQREQQADQFPEREFGRIVPWLTSGH